MIRTVSIPTTAGSRLGCAPGSGCCDECGGHTGPPIGAPAVHTHAIPSDRNSALHAHLGDLPADPGLDQAVADWAAQTNSDADQTALNALLLAGHAAPRSTVSVSTSTGIPPAAIYVGVAVGFVFLLELFSRRR